MSTRAAPEAASSSPSQPGSPPPGAGRAGAYARRWAHTAWVCDVCWRPLDPAQRKRVARAAVAVLTGIPMPDPDRPHVRLDAYRQRREHARLTGAAQPLTYQPREGAVQRLSRPQDGEGRALRQSRRPWAGLARTPNGKAEIAPGQLAQQMQPMPARPDKKPSLLPLERGGDGGRQARVSVFNESTALEPVLDRFGPPQPVTGAGCRMFVWQRASGDGIIAARLSGRDVQQGETANGQVGALYDELTEQAGLYPRLIVLTMENSGYRAYEDRPDLLMIEDLADQDWLKWVAWRNLDRVGREMLPIYTHLEVLKRAGLDLYLLREGGKKDLTRSDPSIHLAAIVANMEGERTHQRTHDALDRRWLSEGRGWPGFKPYATQRDADTKFLVEHAGMMSHVRWLYERYVSMDDSVSVRQLSKALWDERRVRLSADSINRILRDPLYVTGEWCVTYGDQLHPGRAIKWSHPVPMDLYQRVQDLLRLRRGARSVTVEGQFALNGLLRHARCMEMRNPHGKSYRLYASQRRGSARFYHSPGAPECCRGWSVANDVIEPVVMRALRDLADDPQLQRAWMEAAAFRRGRPVAPVDPSQLRTLERELADAERAREKLEIDTAERLARGEEALGRYDKLAGRLEDQIVSLRNQLRDGERALAEAEAARHQLPPVRDQRELLRLVHHYLTDHAPDEPERRRVRATLVKSLLSAVVLHDRPEGLRAELQGWLVPKRAKLVDVPQVLEVAQGALRFAEVEVPGTSQSGEERGGGDAGGCGDGGVEPHCMGSLAMQFDTPLNPHSPAPPDPASSSGDSAAPPDPASSSAGDPASSPAPPDPASSPSTDPRDPAPTPTDPSSAPLKPAIPWRRPRRRAHRPLTAEELRERHRRRSGAAAWSPHDLPTDIGDLPYRNEPATRLPEGSAPWDRAPKLSRLTNHKSHRAASGIGGPAFVSPPLPVPPEDPRAVVRCGKRKVYSGRTELEDCRRALRDVAELLPADAHRLTMGLYISLREKVKGPSFQTIAYVAKREGTSFPQLAWEALWEARGLPAPATIPDCRAATESEVRAALLAAARRTDPQADGALSVDRYYQLLPDLDGYPDLPRQPSIAAVAKTLGTDFGGLALWAMSEVWGEEAARRTLGVTLEQCREAMLEITRRAGAPASRPRQRLSAYGYDKVRLALDDPKAFPSPQTIERLANGEGTSFVMLAEEAWDSLAPA